MKTVSALRALILAAAVVLPAALPASAEDAMRKIGDGNYALRITGLDLQKALADAHHRTAIVFITGYGDVATGVEAMKAGAVDFLTKPFAGRDLLDAIQRALDRDTRALDTEARVDEILQRVKRLTPRETEVFALVVTGMLNKQIAAAIGVGEGTVKVHRARVMAKMHAASLAELVRLADAVGVIVPRT